MKECNTSEEYNAYISLTVDSQVKLFFDLLFKNQTEYVTKYYRLLLLEISKKRYYLSMGFPINFCASLTKDKLANSQQGGNINVTRYLDREKLSGR